MDLAPALPQFNAEAMAQLEAMGFPQIRCQKALLATGNDSADMALAWLLDHSEDPGASLGDARGLGFAEVVRSDIDSPIQGGAGTGGGASAAPEPPAELVSMLADMGFTSAQARKALRQTVSWKLYPKSMTLLTLRLFR